jgi:outer membrane protein assembly factor BamB
MAYDIQTGDKKWKKSAKATEESLVVFDPKGMITFADKVYMYDYSTGEKLWDKPMRMSGAAEFAAYSPQGLVIGIRKLNIRKVPYFEMNCLDPDLGNFRFDDNFKLEGNLLEMWPCDAGVFYTTDRELNTWDASTGKNAMISIAVTAKSNFFDIKSWDYTAPPNGSLLTAFKGEMAYIFNTETKHLYSVNTKTGKKKQLTTDPLVFEDGKTANQIEMREGGIFLASSQSATLLDFEGNETYRVHLPVAKKGFLWKMLAASAMVYQSQRTANDAIRQSNPQLSNNESRTRSEYGRKMQGGQDNRIQVTVNEDAARKILHNRFEASKQGKNSYYIYSQLAQKAGGWLDGEYGLVKVNKDTGAIEKYLSFGKNMQPNFIIDEISGKLFYASGNRILCFDMN